MQKINWIIAIAAVVLFGCFGSAESASQAPTTEPPVSSIFGETPEPIQLTDSSIKRFIQASNKLASMSLDFSVSSSDAANVMQGMRFFSDAMDILHEHGFELTEYQQVGYSIGIVLAAQNKNESKAKLAEARKNLESVQGKLPPEQYKLLDQQLVDVFATAHKQPEGNVALVKKYQAQIESLGSKD